MIYILLVALAYALTEEEYIAGATACVTSSSCTAVLGACVAHMADQTAMTECVATEAAKDGNEACAQCLTDLGPPPSGEGEPEGEGEGEPEGEGEGEEEESEDAEIPFPKQAARDALDTCMAGADCADGAYRQSCEDDGYEFTEEGWVPFSTCIGTEAFLAGNEDCGDCLEAGLKVKDKKKSAAPAAFTLVGTLVALVSALL